MGRQIQNSIMFIPFLLMILMYSIKLCVNIQCCARKQFELLRFTLEQIEYQYTDRFKAVTHDATSLMRLVAEKF